MAENIKNIMVIGVSLLFQRNQLPQTTRALLLEPLQEQLQFHSLLDIVFVFVLSILISCGRLCRRSSISSHAASALRRLSISSVQAGQLAHPYNRPAATWAHTLSPHFGKPTLHLTFQSSLGSLRRPNSPLVFQFTEQIIPRSLSWQSSRAKMQ